jgi:hypothetical protein
MSVFGGIVYFAYTTVITLMISVATTAILAILLHKIRYHINYVIIMTSIILVYMLAQLSHLPGLLLIITFGMVLSNNILLENTIIKRFVDFSKFRNDLTAFRKMLIEFTFLARSFFFIIFGYYTQVKGLFSIHNILTGLSITFSLFFLRMIFIKFFLKMPVMPLLLFIPRGLITIILFMTIPIASRVPLISEQVITLVILMTIFMLMTGNILFKIKRKQADEETEELLKYRVSEETLRLRNIEAMKLEEMKIQNPRLNSQKISLKEKIM